MRGIYEIKNINNGKVYIGESLDITRRWKDHLIMLNEGIHYNYKLQNDFNIYGHECFKFRILILLDEDISSKVGKYLCLIHENNLIEICKRDNRELYNLENSLDNLLSGKRTNDNFDKDTFEAVRKDHCEGNYKLFGGVIFKNFQL